MFHVFSGSDRSDCSSDSRTLHVHLPLHVGDVRGVLVAVDRAVGARRRKRQNHLRRLPRGLLLAQAQHARGLQEFKASISAVHLLAFTRDAFLGF